MRDDLGLRVIGEDRFDGDAAICEPAVRVFPERGGCLSVLVRKNFAVGEAAVSVDRRVDVVVTDFRFRLVRDVGATPYARYLPPGGSPRVS